jgi:hypothetical protein
MKPASMQVHARNTGAEVSSQKPLGFAPSARVQELRKRVISFMEQHIYPSEKELKQLAKSEGLWNLWIPVLWWLRSIFYALMS